MSKQEKPSTSKQSADSKQEKPSTSKQSADNEAEEQSKAEDDMNSVLNRLSKLNVSGKKEEDKFLVDLSFKGLVQYWKKTGFKKIITMVGAGISTSAGIPDFRTPGSGLYDNLKKYNLPYPMAIFSLKYFRRKPQPFFTLAKELYPGRINPTPSHYFVRLLNEKGLLLRHYTQNIDSLERVAGIPGDKLVEAHGTFYTNHCLDCRRPYSAAWMKEHIFADRVPTCEKCKGIVKPDIVFYGEQLTTNFEKSVAKDFDKCDLLIIMGTSLEVMPFADLIAHVPPNCVRLLINRDRVGRRDADGLMYDRAGNTRDVAYIGDADDGVRELAEALGWEKELTDLIEHEHNRLAKEAALADAAKPKPTTQP